MVRLKALIGDSILYGGAAVASKAMGLATFPLLLSELDVEEYGTLDLFGYCLALASVIAVFGLDSALGRLIHDYPEKDRPRFVSTVLLLQGCFLCVAIPLLGIAIWLWLPEDPSGYGYIHLAILLVFHVPFSVTYSLAVGLSQWTFARRTYLGLTLGFSASQAVALLVATVSLDLSVKQIALLAVSVSIFFGSIGLLYLRRFLVLDFDFPILRSVCRFAWPFGAIGLLNAVSPVFERTIILVQLGAPDLGMYSVAGKLAALMTLVSVAFQTAWGPFAVAAHKREEGSRQLFVSVLWFVTFGMIAGSFGLAALARPLLMVFSAPEYLAAVPLVLPLALATGISATAAVMQVGLLIAKQSHLNLVAELAFSFSLLTVAALSVPHIGSTGVASATLVASILRCVLLFALSDNVLDSRLQSIKLWSVIIGSSALCFILINFGILRGATAFFLACAIVSAIAAFYCVLVLRALQKSARTSSSQSTQD